LDFRGELNGSAKDDHRAAALSVIAGHSRSKNGVASLAYDPAIHHSEMIGFFRYMRG
jgi:hypothetical protein